MLVQCRRLKSAQVASEVVHRATNPWAHQSEESSCKAGKASSGMGTFGGASSGSISHRFLI